MNNKNCLNSNKQRFNLRQESLELFFELLKIQVGAKKSLKQHYSDEQWLGAYKIANEQAITGVLAAAIETLEDKSFLPSELVLLRWVGKGMMIEQTSIKMEEAGKATVVFFHENGFACQILKGSAVARYYPQPYKRSSGDIDIWLDGSRERIYNFARKYDKDDKLYGVNYHHIKFHLMPGVNIEVHIWPSYFCSPLRNRRFQEFCKLYKPTMESSMPSLAFDRVFILSHCYRHMCGDGIGIRQVMDYFYVLRRGFTEDERSDAETWIRKLGMGRFAEGLMWVLHEVFGLEDEYLILETNEQEGRFIMNEILFTGNLGHSDKRSWGSKETAASRYLFSLKRDVYMAKHYPHEALWQPFFSLWLYFWRLSKGLLKKSDEL